MELITVLNNKLLRKYILSFLRKKPKVACYYCNCVLIWDKPVKKFVRLPNINNIYGFTPYYSNNISCIECWGEFLKNIYSFNFI